MIDSEKADSSSRQWFHVVDLPDLPGIPCPCGTARRAFADIAESPCSVHLTEIKADAALHFHRTLTETYIVLECEPGAKLQVDDEFIPLRPGRCVLIPPGTRHRAIGTMKVLIVAVPRFDPADEFTIDA